MEGEDFPEIMFPFSWKMIKDPVTKQYSKWFQAPLQKAIWLPGQGVGLGSPPGRQERAEVSAPGAFHAYVRQALVKKLKQARELGALTEHLRECHSLEGIFKVSALISSFLFLNILRT